MDLNEFKQAMSSEATEENKRLKEEIKHLKDGYSKEIAKLLEKNHRLLGDCKVLANRCYVNSCGGELCYMCGLGEFECSHAKSFDEKIAYARKLEESLK